MRRFRPRTALPSTPRRALIFSNTVSEARGLEAIREAGAHAGLDVDALGYGTGSASANPERVLPEYDIVFAKARCAIEAMAVGCAVVTCDVDGLADMVTMNNFEELRRLNFGRRSLVNPLDPTLIFEAIRRYSAPDAERVAKQIRSTAGLDNAVDQLISTYEDVVKEHRRSRPDPSGDLRATATYLSKLDLRDEPQGAARLMPTTTPEVLPRLLSDETLLTPIREFSPLDIEVTGGTIADAGHKRSRGGIPNRSLLLNTPPLPWQYAAILPMPADVPPGLAPRACVIRVRLRVHKGSAGVGVLDEDRTDFLARQSVLASDGLIDVFLRVRRFDSATDLVFQTWDRAEVGLIQIDQIELYLAGLAHLNEGLQNAD
jgi:hypothetical protein